jgi:hypothetical protein
MQEAARPEAACGRFGPEPAARRQALASIESPTP